MATSTSRLSTIAAAATVATATAFVRGETGPGSGELQRNAPAPDFVLQSLQQTTFHPGDLRGKKVLLSFLRNAQCAVCNLWVSTTMRLAPAWRAQGLEVVAVFESTVDKLATQFEGRVPPFAVLADPDGSVHDAYHSRADPERIAAIVASGAGAEALARAARAGFEARQEEGANFFRLPSEVLLHEDGTVALVHVADGVSNHLDPDIVTRFARTGSCD